MRLSSFALAALLAAIPLSTAAVPSVAQCQDRSLWRKASDYLFRTIWNWEGERPSRGIYPNEVTRNGRGVAGKILASYGDDVVLRFSVRTQEEVSSLVEAVNTLFLDVWEFNTDWVDVRVSKDVVPSLLGLLPKSLRNSHKPLFNGVSLAEAIADTYPSPSSHKIFTPSLRNQESGTQRHGPGQSLNTGSNRQRLLGLEQAAHSETSPASHNNDPFFQDYQPLSVITPWMRLMASMFPTHVRMINIGITYEGRDIPALRIGVHPTNKEAPLGPRRTIVIAGGSHAREWIGTSTVTYVAWALITSYGKSVLTSNLLNAFDWVFIPTLNPDGYVFSWETDRLWRKNRQPTSLRFCRGVDLDRSFPYMWDDESGTNPCSESFPGEAPFDGVEAKRFADWARNETDVNNVKFEAFLDLHSYSQQVLYPYSFSCSAAPPTLENLEELALGLAKAMRQFKGHDYKATSACEGNVAREKKIILPRVESGGGSALDWFYHNLTSYAFQIKLRDTGNYGFLLPKENIVPSGKEVLHAVEHLGRFLLGEVGLGVEGKSMSAEHTSKPETGEKGDAVSPEHAELKTDGKQWELRRRRRR